MGACKAQKSKTATSDTSTSALEKNLIITPDMSQRSAPIVIEGAMMLHDSLILSLSYSGGCENHTFSLYTNALLAKSLPPKINMRLIHKDNNDKCRDLIRKTVSFSLKNLHEIYNKNIIINLESYPTPILYQPFKQTK